MIKPALKLAYELETMFVDTPPECKEAATELRKLDAENIRLKEVLSNIRDLAQPGPATAFPRKPGAADKVPGIPLICPKDQPVAQDCAMADHDLIELAAKAAGYPWRGFSANGNPLLNADVSKPEPRLCCPVIWNPRDDDGDALRLAVDMGFTQPGRWPDPSRFVLAGMDWHAATRRAILVAAAEAWRKNAGQPVAN